MHRKKKKEIESFESRLSVYPLVSVKAVLPGVTQHHRMKLPTSVNGRIYKRDPEVAGDPKLGGSKQRLPMFSSPSQWLIAIPSCQSSFGHLVRPDLSDINLNLIRFESEL